MGFKEKSGKESYKEAENKEEDSDEVIRKIIEAKPKPKLNPGPETKILSPLQKSSLKKYKGSYKAVKADSSSSEEESV